MTRRDLVHKYGCPDCGGMVSLWTSECPHCQGAISMWARLDWVDERVRMLLVAVAVTVGVLLGLIVCYMPKPDGITAISAIITVWYAQYLTAGRLASNLAGWAEPAA